MGCCHSKCHTDTIPTTKEPTHNDAITTCHSDNLFALDTETADAICQKHLSPKKVAKDVETALVKYLPEYEFYYTQTGGQISEITMGAGASLPPDKYVMQVAKKVANDPTISLAPDPTGTKLSYGLQPTKYTLYAGSKSNNLIIFVYQWTTKDGNTYITSPYSIKSTKSGHTVPCATVNITNALQALQPVDAIELDLKKLNSVSSPTPGSNHNLNGPDFEWVYGGAYGVAMNIQSSCGLYWQDVNGKNGKVKLIDKKGSKMKVKLMTMP